MFQDNNLVLGHFLEDVARRMEGFSKSGDVLNFRCPICGDSKTNKSKRRAYIYQRDGKWFFHCHNSCGCSLGSTWLKRNYPGDYDKYIQDVIQGSSFKFGEEIKASPIKRTPPRKELFKSIDSPCELSEIAVKYCEFRRIFPEVYKKFLIADSGLYKDRLIIPFYHQDGSYHFFQARALKGQSVKYLSKMGPKEMYGIDFLDKTRDYIVVEGPIDATFLDNSIALVGANVTNLKGFTGQPHFWLDFDETGLAKSKELLEMGASVFNWKKYIRETGLDLKGKMDINQLYVHLKLTGKIEFSHFNRYFTSDYFDSLDF